MLSHSIVWHLLHVVYNILNIQRYATSVAGQTCCYGDRRRREAANISSAMKTFHCYNVVGSSIELIWHHWRDRRDDKTRWGNLLGKYADYSRSFWHEKSTKKPQQTCKVNKSHSKPNCFKPVWKRKDRLWL